MVVIGICWARGVWLISDVPSAEDPGAGGPESRPSVGGRGGREPEPRDQNASQNSRSLEQISPRISTHPSNQLSQLTLQLGINAIFRSTRINLGCITLNGLTKILLTTISNPSNFSGFGKPSENHDEGG